MTKNKKEVKRKHYLVYQIDDDINKKIYIGVHITKNVKDKYMGSGVALKKAFKEYNIENFSKTILYDFNNEKEMLEKEAEIVNEEFVKRTDTYNIIIGGGFNTTGLVSVKDKDNNYMMVSIDDERYLSGELKHILNDKIVVKNKKEEIFSVDKNDERFLNGELVGVTSGTITVKDKNGIFSKIRNNDKRFLNGELVGVWKDKKHTKETLRKIRETYKKTKHQQGENNNQFGTCWILNIKLKQNKKINKTDLEEWEKLGWKKGRKMNF